MDYADFSSRPDIGEEPLTRILLIGLETEPENVNVIRLFGPKLNARCVCPSENDSLYLGEALERVLFSSTVPDSSFLPFLDNFFTRLDEVGERSEYKKLDVWKDEYVDALDEDGDLIRDCELDLESLGDKWYV